MLLFLHLFFPKSSLHPGWGSNSHPQLQSHAPPSQPARHPYLSVFSNCSIMKGDGTGRKYQFLTHSRPICLTGTAQCSLPPHTQSLDPVLGLTLFLAMCLALFLSLHYLRCSLCLPSSGPLCGSRSVPFNPLLVHISTILIQLFHPSFVSPSSWELGINSSRPGM